MQAPYGSWSSLIFDEIYSGFRLAPGGAQSWFDVQADMVLYGKTVAGGLPIGVVCGPHSFMRRFDPDRPMRIAYVVGTFSAYAPAMGAMHEFLTWVTGSAAREAYARANADCSAWVAATNRDLDTAGVPMQVVSLGTIWTITFTRPSRFNWLLQYYLRTEGLNLSWVGTGRCLFSLDFTRAEFDVVRRALVRAGVRMCADKWWLTEAEQPNQHKTIRIRLVKDMVASMMRIPRPVQAFYSEVMRRKHDDHVASHSHPTNQLLHLLSSSAFIVCYVVLLLRRHGIGNSLVWFAKLVTDPITDIKAYYRSLARPFS